VGGTPGAQGGPTPAKPAAAARKTSKQWQVTGNPSRFASSAPAFMASGETYSLNLMISNPISRFFLTAARASSGVLIRYPNSARNAQGGGGPTSRAPVDQIRGPRILPSLVTSRWAKAHSSSFCVLLEHVVMPS